MNLKQVYCYLCDITCEKAQDMDNICQQGIERNLEKMSNLIEHLMIKWNLVIAWIKLGQREKIYKMLLS